MTYFSCKRFLGSASLAVGIGLGIVPLGHAEPLTRVQSDAFYHQLLKLPDDTGYQPTRTLTIIVDTERGNQLVAADDPNLRFNMLWMEQFKPGYRSTRGGSAVGELFRSYVKAAYKAYRNQNAQSLRALPDENGSIHRKESATNFIDAMDYNLRVTDDEVRFKVQYTY